MTAGNVSSRFCLVLPTVSIQMQRTSSPATDATVIVGPPDLSTTSCPGPNGWWGRRFAEVLALRLDDMGGGDLLSESQVSLAKRCTSLEVELERREAQLSTGSDVDMAEFAAMVGTLARVAEKLGLKRVKHDRVPTIAELKAKYATP